MPLLPAPVYPPGSVWLPALAWVFWLAWKTDVQIAPWRRWTALALRTIVCLTLIFAIAGLQWLLPVEGMNVFFVLDRSDSVPSAQQDAAKTLVNKMAEQKKKDDKAGVIIFGTDASIDRMPNEAISLEKVEAVVDSQRSDIAGGIRLATAAFAETGQKRIVLMSDGNENIGSVLEQANVAKQNGVEIDTVTLAGMAYGQTVLSRAVQAAGIEWNGDEAHSAVYDTQKTAELFCKILNRWGAL